MGVGGGRVRERGGMMGGAVGKDRGGGRDMAMTANRAAGVMKMSQV